MSSAAGQAIHAGIRESSSNGQSCRTNATGNQTTFLPQMNPSPEEISKLLASRKIIDKAKKYDLFKQFHSQIVPLEECLNGIRPGAANSFWNLEWGSKVKGASGYTSEWLGGFLFKLLNSIDVLCPGNRDFSRLADAQKKW